MSTPTSHLEEALPENTALVRADGRRVDPVDQELYFLHLKNIVLELHKQSKRPISIDLLVDGARIYKFPGIDAGNNLSWDASTICVKLSDRFALIN